MFDYDHSFRLDRLLDQEDDPLIVCDGCDGWGRHCDTWGPWMCWLCQGKGYMRLSAWLAYVATFPPEIRERLHANIPPLYHPNGKDGAHAP